MLILDPQLTPQPVISIHAGTAVATTQKPIINPHNLTVAGFFVTYQGVDSDMVLVSQDIREVSAQGYIINHEEDLTPLKDLVRLAKVAALNFELLGMKVQTESKRKIGKVERYVVQAEGMVVYNFHVQQSGWKSLLSSARIINRAQVVEVTEDTIIVKDAVIKERGSAAIQPAAAG